MKNLTAVFCFIFVLGFFSSCEPEELSEDKEIIHIGQTGNQEDVPDDDKN